MQAAVNHTCTCGHKSHNSPILTVNRAGRIDPTKTALIRKRFIAEIARRFARLKKVIAESIVDNDCFGIQGPNVLELAPARSKQFDFPTSERKVATFMEWLERQEEQGVLEIRQRPGGTRGGLSQAWTDTYIQTAYQKAVLQARTNLIKAGYAAPVTVGIDAIGQGGMMAAFNAPIHADRLAMLYSRTFDDLRSVTQFMNAQVRRTISDGLTTGLTRGMAEGKSPRVIARELMKDTVNRVDKIGRVRADMIARTETVRAHHIAQIEEYKAYGVEGVDVQAEWMTAGFNVCPECEALEGKTFTLEQIEGMIPVHPNCRCTAVPVVKD